MFYPNRSARINVKVLVILMLIVVALGISLVAARHIRRTILSKRDFEAGMAAFEKEDWSVASRHLQEYLGRNPDDVEMLKKYAKARLAIRPIEAPNLRQAIAAYRRVLQLEPTDKDIYGELAKLYGSVGNFEELAYIARMKLEHDPNDLQAPLWLAEALVRLNKTTEAQQSLEKFIERLLEKLPEKHTEYVRACGLMGNMLVGEGAAGAKQKAVEKLNEAVEYMPDSVEALANRSRFLRVTVDIPGLSDEERRARARKDLEAADELGTEDPTNRLFLCEEWMAHGELDRAGVELQAAENLPQEVIEEHFPDATSFTTTRYTLALRLAMLRGATAEGAALADEAREALTGERYRVQVLPLVIPLYVADANVAKARECLDEYLESVQTQQGPTDSRTARAYLQALVTSAEEKPYDVINLLQPVVVSETSRPELWSLLAEAYRRTDQVGRAVDARREYLRLRPQDFQMTLRLAREHSRLGEWNKAFETAQKAESLNPEDITARLLRIGAGIYLGAEQGQGVDKARLERLAAELAQLRQEHPGRVDIRTLQASVMRYIADPNEMEKELKLVIEESQETLSAEMQLVAYYRQNERMAEAIEVCQAACERHAEVAEPWLSLSELYTVNEDNDAACSCLERGLTNVVSKEAKRSLSIQLALLRLAQGDSEAAERRLSGLCAQDRQEIRARTLLLTIRKVRENKERAEKLIDELKEIEGESGRFWRLHQASLWLSSDDWRKKQQDIADLLQYCMDSDPGWLPPVLLLMDMYGNLGDFRRVEEVLRLALTRNPSATAIADRLLRLLERQGRFVEAEQLLQQIQTQTDPRVTSAWSLRMALGSGDVSRAIEELKLRVLNNDQDASSRIQLARLVYHQTRNVGEASKYLEEAAAITPDSRTLTAVKVFIKRAEGQTEEAQQILDDYVADHNDFNAYWMRAVYLAEEGEFERADKDYKKLTTFTEQSGTGYELLSNFYATTEKLDNAVATLEEGLKAYPENLRLKRRLMETLFLRAQAQDREKALKILTALEEKMPQDPGLMKLRVTQLLQDQTPQSLKTAKEKLETAVRLAPTEVDAHLLLIGIAMQEREFETARDFAIRALGSNPNNSALLSARSRVELALDNTQMAVQLAQLVLREDPNNVTAIVTLADAYRLGGDMDRSEQWIERAEGLDPNDLVVFEARCLWLGSQKRFEELAEICSTQLSTEEQNVRKILIVGSILSRADSIGYKREAVKLFEHALTLSPTTIDANLGLASTLYQIGNAQRAKAIYRELLEQYPDNIRVLNDLAWILQEHEHRYEAALELANRGLRLAPDDLHLLDTRGTILLNMPDRLTDAWTDFETLEQLSPPDSPRQAKTLLKLGRICAQLNDHVQARQHLEKALEIDKRINIFTTDERSEIRRILQESEVQASSKVLTSHEPGSNKPHQ